MFLSEEIKRTSEHGLIFLPQEAHCHLDEIALLTTKSSGGRME